jgi:hypothetical protein
MASAEHPIHLVRGHPKAGLVRTGARFADIGTGYRIWTLGWDGGTLGIECLLCEPAFVVVSSDYLWFGEDRLPYWCHFASAACTSISALTFAAGTEPGLSICTWPWPLDPLGH